MTLKELESEKELKAGARQIYIEFLDEMTSCC